MGIGEEGEKGDCEGGEEELLELELTNVDEDLT